MSCLRGHKGSDVGTGHPDLDPQESNTGKVIEDWLQIPLVAAIGLDAGEAAQLGCSTAEPG